MDPATHAEAVLAMWLSGVAVALVVGLAATVCHLYQGVRKDLKLLMARADLPKLQKETEACSRQVTESALAADAAINGEVSPQSAGGQSARVQNGLG